MQHPFREEAYIPEVRLFPEFVDGVEGLNATHTSPLSLSHKSTVWDGQARAYAKEHGLPVTVDRCPFHYDFRRRDSVSKEAG